MEQIQGFKDRLTALNPIEVINRGYSIVTLDGKVVSKKSQVKSGDDIKIRVSDGAYRATVTGRE